MRKIWRIVGIVFAVIFFTAFTLFCFWAALG